MPTPRLRASTERGQTYDDPSEDAIYMLLEDIESGDDGYLIVELLSDSSGQTYVQSTRNDDGRFAVEYRGGGPSEHYGTTVDDMRAAHHLIAGWCFNLPCWRDSARWSRVTF